MASSWITLAGICAGELLKNGYIAWGHCAFTDMYEVLEELKTLQGYFPKTLSLVTVL